MGRWRNRPIYVALAVNVDGERDILGLWAGEHGDGEGAKFWLRLLTDIKNRGTNDVCMIVCDGLKGLPDAVNAVWDKTIVQGCIVHLLRNSFPLRVQAGLGRDRPRPQAGLCRRQRGADAFERFAEFSDKWQARYPAIIKLWTDAWAEFVPFLSFDKEIRSIICTTNAIEGLMLISSFAGLHASGGGPG